MTAIDYMMIVVMVLLVGLILLSIRKAATQERRVDDLPWARSRGKQCKARLKRGEDPEHWGRCELEADHYSDMWEDHHALERGLVNVRWDEAGNVRYEQS